MNRNEITPTILEIITPADLIVMTPEKLEAIILATYRYDNAITPMVSQRVRYTEVVQRMATNYRHSVIAMTDDTRYSDYVVVSLDALKLVESVWFNLWSVATDFNMDIVINTNRGVVATPTPTPTPTPTVIDPIQTCRGCGCEVASDDSIIYDDEVWCEMCYHYPECYSKHTQR